MDLWLELLFLVGFPLILVVTNLIWIIDHVWLTPQESKIIKRAKRKKKPVVPVAFDNGQCEFKIADEIGDEGYVKTEDKWVGFLPRPVAGNPGEEAEGLNPLISRVFTLKDAKVPFLVGYSGKAILTNPQALAMLEYAEAKKLKLPINLQKKQRFIDVFWPVNLRNLKNVFPKSWNQAQVRASEVKSELTGMLKGKKYFGMDSLKMFVLPGMIIIAIMVIFTLIIIFLR